MADESREHVADLMDASVELPTRVAAAARLIRLDPLAARATLIDLAAKETEEAEVLQAAGKALASCVEVTTPLTEWDFRDMTDAAYDSYWKALP